MFVNKERYLELSFELSNKNVCLVAVSKTKPAAAIAELYELGHRDFGENYVQEFLAKQKELPEDIRWHFIGHLQTNKVKQIVPYVYMIHGVDSEKLLLEIQKQARKAGKMIDVLLQVYIAKEESKFGLDEGELRKVAELAKVHTFPNIRIRGLMGMASFAENMDLVKSEFSCLRHYFEEIRHFLDSSEFNVLSMGMSNDYQIAIDQGSTMVRIGSALFGAR
jgi:pyridoxal phosphate enzyme (YggS family)